MNILISGAGGQLGSDCAQVLGQRHDVVALRSDELDITRSSEVMAVMRSHVPDVVLNCAAYTRVDACETEGNPAREVNVKGAEHMARGAHSIGARMIHISTDYVFDGKKRPPDAYVEDDAPNPLSHYGRTKLESEGVVKACAPAHVIVRTAWLYGITGHNFLKTMLGLAAKDPHKEIKVVNDQFGSPTWTWRVAQQISRLMETDGTGIYHVTAQGYGTWYELATHFLNKMGIENSLVPCTTREYPTPAVRPMNSILDNQRLKHEGIHLMAPWRSDVDRFISRFGERLIKEMEETG